MPTNPYATYLEANVLAAEPVELIRLLYRAALDAVRDARAFLAEHQIPERAQAVSKAVGILSELSLALNPEGEPTLARDLLELYDYMQRRLLAANLDQSDLALEEVARLLTTMSEAWEGISPQTAVGKDSGSQVAAEA